MDITINGTSQKVKILQLLPVDPDQAWKAIFSNSDFVFGEGTKDDFRALPIIMWAAIEVISSGEHFVVGLLLSNLSRFEAPYGDDFLGYAYSLDGTTPSFWQSTARTWHDRQPKEKYRNMHTQE